MTQVLDRIRNGVDSAQMYGTLDAIKENPALGIFQFRAQNHWIDGAHNRSTIKDFFGAGQEDTTRAGSRSRVDAGEPARPARLRHRPEPGRVPLARARRLPDDDARLHRHRAQDPPHRGHLDARGRHGRARLPSASRDDVRNGFTNIRVNFKVKGDAPPEKLRELVERAQARSVVFDMVHNGVPVDVTVEA